MVRWFGMRFTVCYTIPPPSLALGSLFCRSPFRSAFYISRLCFVRSYENNNRWQRRMNDLGPTALNNALPTPEASAWNGSGGYPPPPSSRVTGRSALTASVHPQQPTNRCLPLLTHK